MKYKQIAQDIQLLANHRSVQNIQKISTFQYRFWFVLRESTSIYANNKWQMTFVMPQNYPYSAPRLKFEAPFFHLNIDKEGWVHLGMLKDEWTQMGSLYSILDELENVLQYPDTTHPADKEMLKMYMNNRHAYTEKCLKYFQTKSRCPSRIDSQGKAELEQQINDLNKMRLTRFSGLQDDLKFTLPSNLKSHQSKFEGQISNIFSSDLTSHNQQQQSFARFENSLKSENQKLSTKIQKISNNQNLLQLNRQNKQKDMNFFEKYGISQRNQKKKHMKESKLLSITQSIRGEDNSNIFDLSASKDQKFIQNMKFSKSFGVFEQNQFMKEHIQREGKRQSDQQTMKNSSAPISISTLFQKQFKNQKMEKNRSQSPTKTLLKKPDYLYQQIANRQSDQSTKLMHKVSVQLWKSIQSISQIENNLKSSYVVKNKVLQRVLRTKMQNELQNLQRLQNLESQLKHKIIMDLQNTIRLLVK